MKNKLLFFIIAAFFISSNYIFSQDTKLSDLLVKLINSGEVKSITVLNTSGQNFLAFEGTTMKIEGIEKFKIIENNILYLEQWNNFTCYVSLSLFVKAYSYNTKNKMLYIFL